MKKKTTEKRFIVLFALVGILLVSMAAASAETNEAPGFSEFATADEPMPCSVNSFQETAPFDSILLNPYEWMEPSLKTACWQSASKSVSPI